MPLPSLWHIHYAWIIWKDGKALEYLRHVVGGCLCSGRSYERALTVICAGN